MAASHDPLSEWIKKTYNAIKAGFPGLKITEQINQQVLNYAQLKANGEREPSNIEYANLLRILYLENIKQQFPALPITSHIKKAIETIANVAITHPEQIARAEKNLKITVAKTQIIFQELKLKTLPPLALLPDLQSYAEIKAQVNEVANTINSILLELPPPKNPGPRSKSRHHIEHRPGMPNTTISPQIRLLISEATEYIDPTAKGKELNDLQARLIELKDIEKTKKQEFEEKIARAELKGASQGPAASAASASDPGAESPTHTSRLTYGKPGSEDV